MTTRDHNSISASALILLCLIAVLMAFSALREHLGPAEAAFLNSVIESDGSGPMPQKVQSIWSEVCGLMERPSRLLGLLSTIGGLILLVFTIKRTGGNQLSGLVAAASLGALLIGGTVIGGSTPTFLALAAIIFIVERVLGLGARALGHLSLVIIIVGIYSLGQGLSFEHSLHDLEAAGPDLSIWGLPHWAGAVLTGVIAVAGLVLLSELPGLILVALALGASAASTYFSLEAAPITWFLAAFAVPLGLYAGAPCSQPAKGKPVLALFGVLMLLCMTSLVFQTLRAEGTRVERERLDWIAENVQSSSWIALNGEQKNVLRYYEHCGHRTGHQSILLRNEDDLKNFIRAALSRKPPVVCMVDTAPEELKELLSRYELVELEGVPKGILLARFKRRN